MHSKLGPLLIGLAYLGLVVFIMWFCAEQSASFDDFSKYWGLFGTLIGVATGAIPSFFFKAQADDAKEKASKESEKARLFEGAATQDQVTQVRENNRSLFK